MGVLACDRNGCEHIMCDRHSHEYGYICNECFNELINSGPETNIEQFMATKKESREPRRDEAIARYEAAFKVV